MEKKGITYQTLIIILSIVILISTIVGIFIGSKITKKETKEEEKLPEIKITQKELDILGKYFDYKGNIDGAEKRLALVDFTLMYNEAAHSYTNGDIQSYPYLSKELYEKAYNELYGDNYSLEKDVKETKNSLIYSEDCYGPEKGNVCWNGTWGFTGNEISVTKDDTKTTKDTYTVTGTYTIKQGDEESNTEKGKFTINYTIKNGNKFLKDFKFEK